MPTLPRALAALACLLALGACGTTAAPEHDAGAGTPSAGPSAPVISVSLSDAGCRPQDFNLHPGTVIFAVSNAGSTKVEEMEISDGQGHVKGDVEGVAPGQSKSFVVDLKAGSYRVRCPQDAPTGGTITVS